jgi:hypothetical protein
VIVDIPDSFVRRTKIAQEGAHAACCIFHVSYLSFVFLLCPYYN